LASTLILISDGIGEQRRHHGLIGEQSGGVAQLDFDGLEVWYLLLPALEAIAGGCGR
jgi:hypothetical protein